MRWLLARIDWTLQYSRAEIAAVEARKLLGAKKPAEALAVLDAGDLPTSLRTYATRVTTRGEHGVLATINTKAVYAWRELREQCLTALGRPSQPLPAPVWNPEPQVVLPRLVASAPAFRSLELLPVALGGKPVWLHYRGLGGPAWKTLPAREVRGWVRRATIPAADMVGPGVEYAFSFDPSPDASPAWGPACVTVMPPSLVDTMPRPRIEAGSSPTLALSCSCTGGFPFLLQWNERPDSDFYKVYRDGQLVTETCVAFYPDAPVTPAPGHGYLVEAWRDGRVLAAADVTARSPDVESRETVVPAVRWKKTGAILQWPKLATLHVACFRVLRSAPGAPGQFKPVSEIPSVRLGMNRLPVEPERGRNTYRIVPVNQAGKEGKPVDIVLHWPNNELVEVVLDDLVREARVVGQVAVAGDAARFTGEGHLELPHDEALNLEQGGAIRLEFRADRTDGMPVLLSHGQYQADGWFLQILGRRLILRTTSADLDGPEIVPGRWYALRAEFDGTRASLLVDGKAIAADREMRVTPCKRPLRIGQYDVPGASYAFRGAIRNLKVTSWVQRSDAAVHFDFAGGDLWPLRDGKVKVGTTVVDGRPTIRLEIGDGASRFNSAWIHPERIDLDLASVLRFRVRTTSTEPLALLLQQEKDTDVWRAINLVGRQSAYPSLADLTAQKLNDGQWHEVSLDLRPLIASRLEPGKKPRIKNLIVGSWEQPLRPIVVEFQSFEVTKATE